MGIPVRGRSGTRAQVIFACVLTTAVQLAVSAPPVGAQIDAKKQEAAALETKIAEQGRKLSLADEQFNQARIERQRIEGQAATATNLVAAAETRWTELRAQLAKRARHLYMHPGAAIEAWLGASTVGDLARAHKIGASILTADTELVMATERARQEVLARARRLDGIRAAASDKEAELASRRSEVSSAIGEQRSLLGNVKGEIADLLAEQRAAELAAAQAAEESSAPADDGDDPSPPIIGDGDGPNGPDPTPQPEPEGPPPPVKGGAGKAVQTAAAQLGKPYEWAADGPDSYDCSGLTMYAWGSAGVSLPHSSQAQYSSLPHVARSQIQPGDLLFYGSPIHHVGIYEGGGVMINAPETGENVRRDSISRADYVGAARP
jgi:cell wall-associated NlpC family hydrolase